MQAAALAALCFIPVVAAEPPIAAAADVVVLVFLMLVRSHRTTLLLIPLPAASVCAPHWSTRYVSQEQVRGVRFLAV